MNAPGLMAPARSLLSYGWSPTHARNWEAAFIDGRERFASVRRLAATDPAAARRAIRIAITDPAWCEAVLKSQAAVEHGFAEALAHAAVAHLVRKAQPAKGVRS